MKRVSAFLALAGLFTVSGALAAPVYTSTSSTASFTDSADWCQLASAGCTGTSASPTAWVSASSGLTGYVGLFYDSHDFTVSQDANGMGVISSNYLSGTTDVHDDVAVSFDHLVMGAGAYLETSYVGTVYGTVYLYNEVYNYLTGFYWTAVFDGTPGQSLFVGALSSSQEVAFAVFDVSDTGWNTVDFSVGSLSVAQSPEPGSLALMAPALLGLFAILRRRARKS